MTWSSRPSCAGEPPLARRERTADLDQPNARIAPAQSGDDIQQHVDALARNRAADVQQLDTVVGRRTEKRGGLSIRARLGSSAARGMHTVWYHDDAFGGNDRGRHQRVARRGAHAQDLPRRSHSLEQSPAERPFDDRPAVGPGEHAAKGVEVVAGDERPACRQPCARCA